VALAFRVADGLLSATLPTLHEYEIVVISGARTVRRRRRRSSGSSAMDGERTQG
jgi:hypothetical protein